MLWVREELDICANQSMLFRPQICHIFIDALGHRTQLAHLKCFQQFSVVEICRSRTLCVFGAWRSKIGTIKTLDVDQALVEKCSFPLWCSASEVDMNTFLAVYTVGDWLRIRFALKMNFERNQYRIWILKPRGNEFAVDSQPTFVELEDPHVFAIHSAV